MNQIKFQAIWGRTYMILGILFGILFIIGAVVLKDPAIYLNLLASAIVIYIGFTMQKNPYALYSPTEIKVYGHLGTLRKHYTFEKKSDIKIVDRLLYLNGEKLKISPWMIDKQDWQRFLDFYDREQAFMNELQDGG